MMSRLVCLVLGKELSLRRPLNKDAGTAGEARGRGMGEVGWINFRRTLIMAGSRLQLPSTLSPLCPSSSSFHCSHKHRIQRRGLRAGQAAWPKWLGSALGAGVRNLPHGHCMGPSSSLD